MFVAVRTIGEHERTSSVTEPDYKILIGEMRLSLMGEHRNNAPFAKWRTAVKLRGKTEGFSMDLFQTA